MKEIENKNVEIVRLFLEKIELLTEKERNILISAIDSINHPVFVTV